jgi:carboxymethylenebutenolidase
MAVMAHEGKFPILYEPYGVPVGSGFQPGYLARPDRTGAFPAVIVIPGIKGLTSFDRDACRRLARWGYVAVSVDPYRGNGPGARATLAEAIGAYSSLTDERVLRDLAETLEFVSSPDLTFVDAERVGVVGFDTGGRFGILLSDRPRIAGVAACYAPLGDDDRTHHVGERLRRMTVPVLGLYGADDELIPVSTVDEAAGLAGQWILYEGARHEFLDPDADTFDEAAASDAWTRISSFLGAVLPTPEPATY